MPTAQRGVARATGPMLVPGCVAHLTPSGTPIGTPKWLIWVVRSRAVSCKSDEIGPIWTPEMTQFDPFWTPKWTHLDGPSAIRRYGLMRSEPKGRSKGSQIPCWPWLLAPKPPDLDPNLDPQKGPFRWSDNRQFGV